MKNRGYRFHEHEKDTAILPVCYFEKSFVKDSRVLRSKIYQKY